MMNENAKRKAEIYGIPELASAELAPQIVVEFLSDFMDRRGLRQAWEQVDLEIQREVILDWIKLVEGAVARNYAERPKIVIFSGKSETEVS